MAEIVDFQQYRESRRPSLDRLQAPSASNAEADGDDASAATVFDPVDFGWLALERDARGRAVRWFHPGFVAQLGYVPETPEWVFLDDSKQIRAWRSLDAGAVAEALSRRVMPEPELAMPFRS